MMDIIGVVGKTSVELALAVTVVWLVALLVDVDKRLWFSSQVLRGGSAMLIEVLLKRQVVSTA